MEQELAAAKHEIHELKQKLHEKDAAKRDLETDLSYHAMKAQELQSLLDAKDTDEFRLQVQAKILQNAGLTAQVQKLRHELGVSSMKETALQSELKHASDTVKRLGEERRSHQRMLVGFGDVVRLLGEIDVEFENLDDEMLDWMTPDRSFDNIKLKIYAIESDRQKLIQENQELQTELFEKTLDIHSYDSQAQLIDEINADRDRLRKEREELQSASDRKDAIIQSLEQSLATKVEKAVHRDVPSSIVCDQNQGDELPEEVESELRDDGSAVIVQSTASVSRLTVDRATSRDCPQQDMEEPNDEACSLSPLGDYGEKPGAKQRSSQEEVNSTQRALEDEIENLKTKFEETRQQEEQSNAVRQNLQEEVANLKNHLEQAQKQVETTNNFQEEVTKLKSKLMEAQKQLNTARNLQEVTKLKKKLEEAQKQVKTTRKKQELREKLLRDVIFQYKELQKEYDYTSAQLLLMQQIVETRCVDSDDPANSITSPNDTKKSNKEKTSSAAELEESPTFETNETSTTTSNHENPSMDATVTSSAHTSMSGFQVDLSNSMSSLKDFKQLEKDHARLETEYEDAAAQIANLEQDLRVTKKELERLQSSDLEKQIEIAAMQKKYNQMQCEYNQAVESTSQLHDELELTQDFANEVRDRLDQRELDLSEVIDQYKHLMSESENDNARNKMKEMKTHLDQTKAQMASVEHELAVTKRHTKRNDLIYDHIRMEKQIEVYKVEFASLQRKLKVSKTEAARNKEEAKGTRKRLVGCHFRLRQLKTQYDEIMNHNTKMDITGNAKNP